MNESDVNSSPAFDPILDTSEPPAPPAILQGEALGDAGQAPVNWPIVDVYDPDDGGSNGPEVLYIYYADGSEVSLIYADMFEDYDSENDTDWSAEFAIDGSMTGVVVYNSEIDRFVDDGGFPPVQTAYRLPLVRGGKVVSSGGVYEEVIKCMDGSPVTQLIKIG
jgi:hypothetical protein